MERLQLLFSLDFSKKSVQIISPLSILMKNKKKKPKTVFPSNEFKLEDLYSYNQIKHFFTSLEWHKSQLSDKDLSPENCLAG